MVRGIPSNKGGINAKGDCFFIAFPSCLSEEVTLFRCPFEGVSTHLPSHEERACISVHWLLTVTTTGSLTRLLLDFEKTNDGLIHNLS